MAFPPDEAVHFDSEILRYSRNTVFDEAVACMNLVNVRIMNFF